MNTPLYDLLVKNSTKKPLIAHMPGHGGQGVYLQDLGKIAYLDTTETVLSDNLYAPHGAMKESFALAAKTFGSMATVFSCGGATLGLQAMLLLAVGKGGTLIADRRCHQSLFHGAVLLDIQVVWLSPQVDMEEPAVSYIDPVDLRACMLENPQANAVFITSPTYFGTISPINALASVVHGFGLTLCVDNAHGTHLVAWEGGIYHPIRQGADYVVDSAHKTLPALTGGAFLHSNVATEEQLLQAMSLFGSTSPSFLIAASLDLARAYLDTDAATDLRHFIASKASFGEQLMQGTPFRLLGNCKICENYFRKGLIFDPIRVTIICKEFHGEHILQALARRGVICEMATRDYVVLILPLHTREQTFERLLACLLEVAKCEKRDEKGATGAFYSKIPLQKCSCREAYFSPKERISVAAAEGRIAATPVVPYPPGIPLIVAGEVFDQCVLEQLPAEVKMVEVLRLK